MKTHLKYLVLAICASLNHFNLYSQQPFWNIEHDQTVLDQKTIDSLKIYDVKAYLFNYTNGKVSEQGILVEHSKYNIKGLLVYDFTAIDPSISYIKAKKTLSSNEYRENVITDGGLYEVKAGSGNFAEVYMLSSVDRQLTYSENKLVKIFEKYVIDNDTNYTLSQFVYDANIPKITEQVISKSYWVISSSRDLYLNDHMNITAAGPFNSGHYADYYFDPSGNIQKIEGKHTNNDYSILFYYNAQNKLEKIVGNYGKSKKPFSEYNFQYDMSGNRVFSDINDVPGHIQIKKRFDSHNNIIEYERIQIDKNNRVPNLADARYIHRFYKYDNHLLKECVSVEKNMDTLNIIRYKYVLGNDHSLAISEEVQEKLKQWSQKGMYESSQEYNIRTSEVNLKKQAEIFRQEALNELGAQLYNIMPKSMEYNADTECFNLTFEELNPQCLYVPRKEAENFKKNMSSYTIYPQFEEGKDGLILKGCTVKSTNSSLTEYKTVTQ